ncbi:CsgG/HfaB family protein [Govanella unica]|uniref:Peptidoglycan-binding protein n=1 Tax=Govanella unica TaxID=2975056 RepID=A0A9X3TZS5_9PROT|nr:CsgG/HfaB family protein [Govania unica]MDA5194774.1 peptidoglycan-binding protein [Govania unica]
MLQRSMRKTVSLMTMAATVVGLSAQMPLRAETAQQQRAQKTAEIPRCNKKIGTIAIAEPERNWWSEYQLGSPEALLKVFVMQSGCFSLVDRGKGMAMMQQERALASGGDLRGGSNIGKGQVKAADYVLVPDLVSQNSNSGGNAIGGIVGGLLGGAVGGLVGGINIKKKTADVVLTVTDVRSSEQLAIMEGHSKKSDLGWGAGGGLFTGGALIGGGASGYANTEIGQVITLAYLDAYTKLVDQFGGLSGDASGSNVRQSVQMTKPSSMYTEPSMRSTAVRPLDPGMTLYPTGNKNGMMWEVEDELGHKGWVSSIMFELAK